MTQGPEWFAPKRYGYGAGFPITWQGWLITIAATAIAVGSAIRFDDRPDIAAAIIIPLVIVFLVIAVRTTRGGWRWRWGERD